MLAKALDRRMKLRFTTKPNGRFGPRYWVFGTETSRKTYWCFVHLRIWLAKRGL